MADTSSWFDNLVTSIAYPEGSDYAASSAANDKTLADHAQTLLDNADLTGQQKDLLNRQLNAINNADSIAAGNGTVFANQYSKTADQVTSAVGDFFAGAVNKISNNVLKKILLAIPWWGWLILVTVGIYFLWPVIRFLLVLFKTGKTS